MDASPRAGLNRAVSYIWPFCRSFERQMIPFQVNGIVEQFRGSQCDRAIILEEPFFNSDPAQRTEGACKIKPFYLAHDCSQFQKPATRISQ